MFIFELAISTLLIFFLTAGRALICDVVANEDGIYVLLFGRFTLKRIPYNRIEYVGLREHRSFFIAAYGIRNRLFSEALVIDLKENWFAPSLIVTPIDRDKFLATMTRHGIALRK